MFEDLNSYFLKRQKELRDEHAKTSPSGLEKAVFIAKEEFHDTAIGKPGVLGKLYSDPELIKCQIDYVLLQELYCEKLTDEAKKVKAWRQLDSSYSKLGHMLVQARHEDLKPTTQSLEKRSEKIKQEVEKMQPSDPNDSKAQDFINLIAFIKEKHRNISSKEANDSLKYYEKLHSALSEQLKQMQPEQEKLSRDIETLKERQKTQKPLSRLERWAVEVYYAQANPLKQLVVWLNRLNPTNLQASALRHYNELRDTAFDIILKGNRISALKLQLSEKSSEICSAGQEAERANRRIQALQPKKEIDQRGPADTGEKTIVNTFDM